ncbi:MAG: TrkH family potassium uptake protein [Pseudomonadota bacterium]
MNTRVVQWILGVLLMLFSITMLPPALIAVVYHDGNAIGFARALGLTALSGLLMYVPVRRLSAAQRENLRLRDGFVVVAGFWIVLGLFGAIPLLLLVTPVMSLPDAVFESMSGLTTTGATVLTNIEAQAPSVLYYRQQLQWLGGMGIIVLAVAVLPMLGVGGMQLYRAETPGPMKDSKLTPRITETAKYLWLVYLGMTLACFLGYWSAGMDVFDAVGHSFSTVAIGGFSTHDASFGWFDNPVVEVLGIVFMFLAGVNFSLHFAAVRSGGQLSAYVRDPEFRYYFGFLVVLSLICIVYLAVTEYYASNTESVIQAVFHAVSIATTTGFATDNYTAWPGALPVLLVLASFIGGCAGSTAGGMKVVRWVLIYKQGMREVFRLVHPHSEVPVKLGNRAVPLRVVESVWGFFSVYLVVFGSFLLMMMVTGLDPLSAFGAVAATLNNLGPGLGEVAGNFATVPDAAKWISVGAMLLGRLEIFTLLVLLTPTFWRR